MQLTTVGEVIATRVLINIGSSKDSYVVKLGMPRKFSASNDFYCPVQIKGAYEDQVSYSAGIDAVQAVQLAMRLIGGKLLHLNQQLGGTLRWEGDEAVDL